MRRVLSSLVLIALLGLAIWYVWGRLGGEKQIDQENQDPPSLPPPLTYATKPEIGYLSPDFLLKTVDGREVRLSYYLDKRVIVNFWSTRFPFCLTELKNYSRSLAENSDKLVVIAINRGEASIIVDNFLNSYIRPSNIVFVVDPDDTIYGRYNGTSMPESFFIDTSGVIRDHKLGELVYDEMRKRINDFLKLSPYSTTR